MFSDATTIRKGWLTGTIIMTDDHHLRK